MTPADLDSLFLEVLGLEPEQREGFLVRLDPDVRADLEAKLRAKEELEKQSPDYLDGPIGLTDPQATKDTARADADESRQSGQTSEEAIPERIGRFPIRKKLAQGGQGVVYLADDPERRNERVVIKVSRNAWDNGPQEALKQEAEVLASLDHPGLGKLIGLEFDNGRPLVVLEHIPGQSLEQKLATEKLGPTRAAQLVAKLADAVHYAHNRGVVHQDLKPANVVFSGAQPKVIDFGLARERSAYFVTPEYEAIGGTPNYIAPEQAQNYLNYKNAMSLTAIDHRADVFGLGAILYRMLTGVPPFPGRDVPDLLTRAASASFDKARLDAPSIPGNVRDACLKALNIDPGRRYETAKELATALRVAVGETEVSTPSLPSRRVMVASAIGVVAIVAFLFWQFGTSDRPEDKIAGVPAPTTQPDVPVDAIGLDFGWIRFTQIRIDYREGHIGDLDHVTGQTAEPLFEDGDPLEYDQLRVEVGFSEPRYAFLFALNPDGDFQECFPNKDQADSEQPQPTRDFDYPVDPTRGFNFSDGAGMQAFFLVTSTKPLGSLNKFRSTLGEVDWPPPSRAGAWVWDQSSPRAYWPPRKTRGPEVKIPGLDQFAGVARRIEAMDPSIDVYGLMFPVDERSQ